MAVKDWRGTPIKVGSIVVYPTRSQGRMWMTEGVVVTVGATVGVKRRFSSVEPQRKATNIMKARTSYPSLDRLTVIT